MITRTTIRPEWLAARYGVRLLVARTLIHEHVMRHWRRFAPLAVIAGGLWLADLAEAFALVALPGWLHVLLWPAAVLLVGLQLWLAQRAARDPILAGAARLARDPMTRRRD